MATMTTTWRDIPSENIVRLLGENGTGFHPRDICDPAWIASRFDIPLDLLPVGEILADEARGITVSRDGKPVRYVQGVVAGDLIDAIAKGLGIARPADARNGYSGGRLDLAAEIVRRIKAA